MRACIFGVSFLRMRRKDAAEYIIECARKKQKTLVITPNVDHIIMMQEREDVRTLYQNAESVFVDGMPIVWLSRLLPDASLPERVTGADLLFSVCEYCARDGLTIAFVGGLEGVAIEAAERMTKRYPGLRVVGTYSPPFGFENDETESRKIVDLCGQWKPDILSLGLGTPKQELWAQSHLDSLECGPVLCFGAAIDFAADRIKRAPVFMQNAGLEWFWRLLQEPRRMWHRYLVRGPRFFIYALRELCTQWLNHFKKSSVQ